MLNFRFSPVHSLLEELNLIIRVSHRNMRVVAEMGQDPHDPQTVKAVEDAIQAVKRATDDCLTFLSSLNCPHIDQARNRLVRWPFQPLIEWSELNTRSRALRDAIETELRGYWYFQYSKEKAQSLFSWKDDWKGALEGFSAIERDVFSATDCYALGHTTASAYHCMRILEVGLKAIAADLGLIFDLQQWHNIIDQIGSAITGERKTLPKGSARNERLQFLSEAAKEFFYFKDGWRNHVAHAKTDYDEHQALSILIHTRAFMNHIASRFSEPDAQ